MVAAVLVFLAIASGAVVWEALATGFASGHELAHAALWRARLRFTVGVFVLAMVLWVGLGLLTHAR